MFYNDDVTIMLRTILKFIWLIEKSLQWLVFGITPALSVFSCYVHIAQYTLTCLSMFAFKLIDFPKSEYVNGDSSHISLKKKKCISVSNNDNNHNIGYLYNVHIRSAPTLPGSFRLPISVLTSFKKSLPTGTHLTPMHKDRFPQFHTEIYSN